MAPKSERVALDVAGREVAGNEGNLSVGRSPLHVGNSTAAALGVAAEHDDRRAALRELRGRRPADAACGAGHDTDATSHRRTPRRRGR